MLMKNTKFFRQKGMELPVSRLSMLPLKVKWSPHSESDRRPHPYQGCALPAELCGHKMWSPFFSVIIHVTGREFRHVPYHNMLSQICKFEHPHFTVFFQFFGTIFKNSVKLRPLHLPFRCRRFHAATQKASILDGQACALVDFMPFLPHVCLSASSLFTFFATGRHPVGVASIQP